MSEHQCGHTVEIGTCTLLKGHTLGHHDETNNNQWWDRENEHGLGAYSSIHPGDKMYRHEFGQCFPNMDAKNTVPWCPWCLRYLLDKHAVSFGPQDCNYSRNNGSCSCSGELWRPEEVKTALDV